MAGYDDYAAQVEAMKRRRQMAQALSQGGADRINQVGGVAVPYHWGEGLAQLGRAWLGGRAERRVDEEEKGLRKKRSEDVARVMSEYDRSVPDEALRRVALELMPSEDVPALEYKRQLMAESGPQGVQSTVIGEDGYYHTVDRMTGKMTNTGIRAAPNMRVIEQEGGAPIGVVTGRGRAGSTFNLGLPGGPAPMRKPTAGERAGGIAQATADVELATKPEIARRTEVAKITGAAEGDIQKKAVNAETITGMLDLAEPLIDVSTGSTAGAMADDVAAFFGGSLDGAQAIAQLQILQTGLMLNQPRMEGPQSNIDAQLYKQAAGQIGDPKVPRETRKAAVKTIRQLQQKYKAAAAKSPAAPAGELSDEELLRRYGGS